MEKIFQKKQELRHKIETQRRALPNSWVQTHSLLVMNQLKRLPEFQAARCVHSYVAWRKEVDTHELIRELLRSGRRVVVPVVDLERHTLLHSEIKRFEELRPGSFGILEPPPELRRLVDTSDLELIIVPGVAFDLFGRRIGYGGGYYDDFLKSVKATKVGLAFEFQIVENIPVRDHDQNVDIIVTDLNVYRLAAGEGLPAGKKAG